MIIQQEGALMKADRNSLIPDLVSGLDEEILFRLTHLLLSADTSY
jgi:hypothetical protein